MQVDKLVIRPYRISTMVITGKLNTKLNLVSLFQQLPSLLIPISYPDSGILKMEHHEYVIGSSARDILTKRRVATKTFFNQSTLVLRQPYNGIWKEANMKLFANGGFQMTGIPTEQFARDTVQWLLEFLQKNLKTPIWEITPPLLLSCTTQLLNSDYTINATILRTRLHKLLTKQYNLFSTYESTIYQGVNTKYYYNESRTPDQAPGICHCTKEPCTTGQGSGKGEGQCKKITISAFQTGSIIVTGARYIKQIDEAYDFFNTILRNHCADVLQPIAPPAAPAATATAAAENK